jgi:hypothetical protein
MYVVQAGLVALNCIAKKNFEHLIFLSLFPEYWHTLCLVDVALGIDTGLSACSTSLLPTESFLCFLVDAVRRGLLLRMCELPFREGRGLPLSPVS